MKNLLLLLSALAMLVLALPSCAPNIDRSNAISLDSLPRTPRHNYPVIFYNDGRYLHLENKFVNDTLCNYFQIRSHPHEGDTLIYESQMFPNRPRVKRSKLFVGRDDRIWWYLEGRGTWYWQEEEDGWQVYRYEKPWDNVQSAHRELKRYAPLDHPH